MRTAEKFLSYLGYLPKPFCCMRHSNIVMNSLSIHNTSILPLKEKCSAKTSIEFLKSIRHLGIGSIAWKQCSNPKNGRHIRRRRIKSCIKPISNSHLGPCLRLDSFSHIQLLHTLKHSNCLCVGDAIKLCTFLPKKVQGP